MEYVHPTIAAAAHQLHERLLSLADAHEILRAVELKALYDQLKTMPADQKPSFGLELNTLKQSLIAAIDEREVSANSLPAIDVTAPFAANIPSGKRPHTLPAMQGSVHPLMSELAVLLDIAYRMGFTASLSRELDDDYHMFGSLNFPEGHPARDDYDTFMTEQTDQHGKQFIAPAHTSTMQNRMLRAHKAELEAGRPIAVIIPDRVFRNEDLDARHEHTFYQHEGIYVDKGIHAGHLIATLKTFLQAYYGKELEVRTQPFYFPFTEPSFEFAIACPFCDKQGCSICSHSGWIELLGCGMIHPNVLREAGIDPMVYTGFAWGGGIDRLVMMKHSIEDVRHFESGKLEFLRQFA